MKAQLTFVLVFFFILFSDLYCFPQVNNSDMNNAYKNLVLPAGEKTEKLKADLKTNLNNLRIKDRNLDLDGKPDVIRIFNNRIDFTIKNQSTTFFFSDLLDTKIESEDINKTAIYFSDKFAINFGDFTFYTTNNQRYSIQGLEKTLTSIQKEITLQRDKIILDSFIPVAENYKKLIIKPEMSEEQRKLFVQANSVNEKKMYDDAIELYEKAIELNQTSYPPAYYNLALLYAQVKNYYKAIVNMTKYILLVPDAPDARSSQDKIYEWELLIKD